MKIVTAIIKPFKLDEVRDALTAIGVHGIGGATGTLLCGVFATAALSVSPELPNGAPGLFEDNPKQVLTQLYGIVAAAAWSGIATYLLLKVVQLFVPLRASPEDETAGLDISLHGESLQ